MTRKSNIGRDTKRKLIKGAWAWEKSYCEGKKENSRSQQKTKTSRQNNVLTRYSIISIDSGQKLIWKRTENEMRGEKKEDKMDF